MTEPVVDPYNKDIIREHMVTWFLHHFEDPVHSCPFDSAEGGYQYIWGGPVETRDELDAQFSDVFADDLIEAAAEELENHHDVFDWCVKPRREDYAVEEEHRAPAL